MMRSLRLASALAIAGLSCAVGCASAAPPDPRGAAEAYAAAVASGDGDRLYDMLSEEDRRGISREQVRALVARDRQELAEYAHVLASPSSHTAALATIRFKDGEQATLLFEGGRFRVSSAGTMPGGARSPEEALEQLRRALSRRSYAALLRVLSPETRAAVERDLRGLVTVLEKSGTLPVQTSGDTATVKAPDGHRVKLRREGTVWYVEDFD
jgi:hypothetical protein